MKRLKNDTATNLCHLNVLRCAMFRCTITIVVYYKEKIVVNIHWVNINFMWTFPSFCPIVFFVIRSTGYLFTIEEMLVLFLFFYRNSFETLCKYTTTVFQNIFMLRKKKKLPIMDRSKKYIAIGEIERKYRPYFAVIVQARKPSLNKDFCALFTRILY